MDLTIEALMAKVQVDEVSGCWNWTAGKSKGLYGSLYHNGKFYKAHRVMYELSVGPIPDGKMCLHRCNNHGCIRPAHLYVGDHLDNMQDLSNSGMRKGERHNLSKLTEVEVRYILSKRGVKTQWDLATELGVSQSLVSHIQNGRAWTHVS